MIVVFPGNVSKLALLICFLNRGSYMSAHLLLNFLNEFGEKR